MDAKLSSIGPYRVESELGRGGMGVVYLGTDTRLDRKVAIKALPEALAGDAERMARLEREAKILAALNHPNIAGIYGYEEKEGAFYLVLEYVEGPTLAERLAEGPLSVTESLELAAQIAAGIAAAHEAGVIHRDLKPGNIKITAEGRVKVLDFGLAKMAGGDPESGPHLSQSPTRAYAETKDGIVLGTAGYMSPEQARGKSVDRRTDLWAMGCVLYEMLTGRQAFRGETISDTLAAVLRGDPDWGILPSQTPASVRRLLRRCLEKDARKRLRDASDARIELEEALAEPPGTPVSGATAAAMAKGRRPLRAAAYAVLLLLAGSAAGGWLWSWFAPGVAPAAPGASVTRLSLSLPQGLATDRAFLSPDGRTVTLLGSSKRPEGGAKKGLFLRPLDQFSVQLLPGSEAARGMAFSEDGKWIYFTAAAEDRSRLFRMPTDGSAPPVQVDEWTEHFTSGMRLPGGDLLMVDREKQTLVRLPIGKPAERKTLPLDLDGLRGRIESLSPLPDERAVLANVIYYGPRGFVNGVGLVDLATGKVRLAVEEGGNPRYHRTGHLLFTRSETLLAVPFDLKTLEAKGTPMAVETGLRTENTWAPAWFELSENGTLLYSPGGRVGGNRGLALVGPDGKAAPWSSDTGSYIGALALSPDQKTLAVVVTNDEGIDEIWLSGTGQPGLRRFAAVPNTDLDYPVWTPDGSALLYQRTAKDAQDGIYRQALAGGAPVRLLPSNGTLTPFTAWGWTPQGDLVVMRRSANPPETRVVPGGRTGTEADLKPLFPGVPEAFEPAFSPDGRNVAYAVAQGGRSEVYLAGWKPGADPVAPVPVTGGGGYLPQWSADGRTLYFLKGFKVMSVAVPANGGAAGAPLLAADLGPYAVNYLEMGLEVTKDGRFLFVRRGAEEEGTTGFNLVLGWDRELKAKVPTAKP